MHSIWKRTGISPLFILQLRFYVPPKFALHFLVSSIFLCVFKYSLFFSIYWNHSIKYPKT